MGDGIGFGFYQFWKNMGKVGYVSVFSLRLCGRCYFLTCICMWQISQINTCLRVVVGPGLVSTSPAFMRSIASHPAGQHVRLAQKR